jgi:hypothetical protein
MPVRGGRYNVASHDAKGEANRAFVDGGVPTTLLYPSMAWEDFVRVALAPRVDGTLALRLPFGGTVLPGMAAADVGPCALALFASGDEAIGKAVGLAGDHLSGAELADALSLALRTRVVHAPDAPATFAARDVAGAADLSNLFRFKQDFEPAYRKARSVRCTRDLHPGALTFAAWAAWHRDSLLSAFAESAP